MKEDREIIKESLEELVNKMGFEASIEIEEPMEDDQESIVCNISSEDDSNLLIGQHGANLQAMQHIARLIVRKKTATKTNFILDVNSYRKEKNSSVIEMAKDAAKQAMEEKRAVVMKPMSNYERRIVHLELSKNDKISTESIGEGDGRKVVMKPIDLV